MQGTAGDKGDPKAKDPVDRESSRVQAVACFFPPTDFLNYGKPGEIAIGAGRSEGFQGAVRLPRVRRQARRSSSPSPTRRRSSRSAGPISPINHVSADDPPTLIIHGDADKLVPIQQAEIIVEKLKEAGVEAKLVVKPGAGHGWPDSGKDVALLADWFDAHLKKKGE